MRTKTYCASKYLTFISNGTDYEIFHELSGKSFKVDRNTFTVLKGLKKPASIDFIRKNLTTSIKRKYAPELIKRLLDAGLVLDDPLRESTPVIETLRIFGVDEFSKQDGFRIVFLGIPYGDGNGTDKNCRLFPGAIRSYLYGQKVNLKTLKSPINFRAIDRTLDYSSLLECVADCKVHDWGDLYIRRMEERKQTFQNIFHSVKFLITKGSIPFLLGGDHSISYPALKAVNEVFERFVLLHFDAHQDMYGQRSLPSSKKNLPHHGNFINHALGLAKLRHIYQVGIRGVTSLSHQTNDRVTTLWATELPESEVLIREEHIDLPMYITFDIDCISPTIAPATATPVPGEITPFDIRRLLSTIQKRVKVIGIDVVEVNPIRDVDNRTMHVSSEIILALLAVCSSRQ